MHPDVPGYASRSSCAALRPHPEKGEVFRWTGNQPEGTSYGAFAGHIGQRHQWSGAACFCGSPPFWRANAPSDWLRPLWWKGTSPVRPTKFARETAVCALCTSQ